MSSSGGNDDHQLQQAPKRVKPNNFHGFFNNGSGAQMINTPSPSNVPFVFTSPSAIRPVTTHMARPGAPQGSELQRQMPLYNQRMPVQLSQNLPQPRVQPGHPQLLPQTLPWQHQHSVQLIQPQISLGENLLNRGVSTGQEAVRAGFYGNPVKRYIPMEFSLDNFPYYLSERTKHLLVASYFLHMNNKVQMSTPRRQHTDRVLLLSLEGSDAYHDGLAAALSHHFGVKLLVFDCQMNRSVLSTSGRQPSKDVLRFHMHSALKPETRAFKIGDRVIFTGLRFTIAYSKISLSGPSFGYRGKVVAIHTLNGLGVRFDLPIPGGNDLGGVCEAHRGFFCDGNEVCLDVEGEIKPIFSPIQGFNAEDRLIVFVKRTENCLVENLVQGINNMVNRFPNNVFVIGSHIVKESTKQKENLSGTGPDQTFRNAMLQLLSVFSDKINIEMPKDKQLLNELKGQMIRDNLRLKSRENIARLKRALTETELEFEDFETVQVTDQELTNENADKVVKWALGRQLTAHQGFNSNSKLVMSRESIEYGLDNLRAVQTVARANQEGSQGQGTPTSIALEKRILEDVILHDQIEIKFDDIGGLDNIKNSLKELIVLPMKRPGLFRKGQLRKLCRGILLFGPPGTGKTMLAKAVAAEAGANLFNISASIIASKWSGADSQNYVKALFSSASKMAPAILFIDEVDSLCGNRLVTGPDMIKIKNEFMLYWGLLSKDAEKVVVLSATNRPFDLDDSFIRRLPRRLMVNLPDLPSRCKILKTILEKEDLTEDVDLKAIAQMTSGFSGNDLENLCIAAAHCPIGEIILKDELKCRVTEEEDAEIRPLNMKDFNDGFEQVKGGSANGWKSMTEVLQWNSLNGGGGNAGSRNSPANYYI